MCLNEKGIICTAVAFQIQDPKVNLPNSLMKLSRILFSLRCSWIPDVTYTIATFFFFFFYCLLILEGDGPVSLHCLSEQGWGILNTGRHGPCNENAAIHPCNKLVQGAKRNVVYLGEKGILIKCLIARMIFCICCFISSRSVQSSSFFFFLKPYITKMINIFSP